MQLLTEARRYVKSGLRHRWKSLFLAWLICVPGWIGVQTLPSQYQSSTRVYADADAVLGALLRGIAIDSSPANQVELLQRTLLSRPNLERVIARTDLDLRIDSVQAREAMLAGLAKSIRIAAQTKNLFTITYTDQNARLARDVVQTVLTLFIEQATVTDRQQMENAQTFVNQQIAAYENQLREAEQRRADFRARYVDLLPEGPAGATGLEAGRARLRGLRGELEDARNRLGLLRRQLETTPAMINPTEAVGDGRLLEAERVLRELRLRFTEQHPEVVAARNILATLRAGGAGATVRAAPTPNPAYEPVRLRIVDSEAQIASLERRIRDEEAGVERLEALARSAPQLQAEFINLDRDYAVLRRNYEELLARRESLQLAGAARTGADRVRLEVVDPPTVPTRPSGPNRLLLSAAVLVVGLGAGAALAFLMTQLDRSFYTVHDLRKLGLPVLGAISPATPLPPRRMAAVAFVGCFGLLLAVFGAVATRGPELLARLTGLVGRLTA